MIRTAEQSDPAPHLRSAAGKWKRVLQMPVTPPTKCPRCGGVMLTESDAHSVYSSCLACGYVYESNIISVFELEREQAVEEGRQRRRQPSHGKLRL
jgi:ribosomal protein S27AE